MSNFLHFHRHRHDDATNDWDSRSRMKRSDSGASSSSSSSDEEEKREPLTHDVLTAPLKSLTGAKLPERIYAHFFENERRMPFWGYSHEHLLPTDRPRFSDETGDHGRSTFTQAIEHAQIPPEAVWEIVIDPNSDSHGWHYSLDFKTFKEEYDSGSNGESHGRMVRRRLWVAVDKDKQVVQAVQPVEEPEDAPAPPKDEFFKMVRISRHVKIAARKFKNLTKSVKTPLIVKVVRANDIRGADWNGKSDPFVIVTGHRMSDGQAEEQQYYVKSDYKRNTVSPEWNEELLLPAVDNSYKLFFTVCDDDVGKDDFLGQTSVLISDFSHPLRRQQITLPLGKLVMNPLRADRSEREFADLSEEAQGSLTVELCPLRPSTSSVGYLDVLKKHNDGHTWSMGKEYRRMYTVLTGDNIHFYRKFDGHDDMYKCSPKITVPVDKITAIVRFDDGRCEFFLKELHCSYSFKIPDDGVFPAEKIEYYRRTWLHKISLAADLDVESEAEAFKEEQEE